MTAARTPTPLFGIDLGTTCSAIGWIEDGRPRLLPVDGEELLPSVVYFPEGHEPVVGRAALHSLVLEPERCIRSAKRFMGSEHRWQIGERVISPPEVGALVLRRLCAAAEEATGVEPRRVVITVPAWFTQAQRADTRRAGELAGLETARIINEPTAAALAHAHGAQIRRRALAYDLGGGTFDVSLVEQDGPVVEVRASHGDTHLGGDDVDAALVERVLAHLRERDPELAAAVRTSTPALVRLLQAVEAAKIELSAAVKATLRVPFLLELGGEARHLELELTRTELEAVARPFVARTLDSVDRVLADAGLEPGQVDELLLVGGSSRMPLVWESLRSRYGLEGSAAIPPDRAVALGAAIQAAIVGGSRVDGILVDVAPYSLSVSALTGDDPHRPTHMVCRVVTPRNAPLPSRHSEIFQTISPFQEEVTVHVFQGSDANPLRNTVLGEISIQGLPPAPEGEETRPISVEFRHDLDGMVSIRIADELTGQSVDGRIAADGEEVAELRQQLLDELEELDLTPGDGSSPAGAGARSAALDPPLTAAAPSGAETEFAASLGTFQLGGADAEEAQRTFLAVLEKLDEIRSSHPDQAPELEGLVRQGEAALAQGETDRAIELYDALTDLMFELGLYL